MPDITIEKYQFIRNGAQTKRFLEYLLEDIVIHYIVITNPIIISNSLK